MPGPGFCFQNAHKPPFLSAGFFACVSVLLQSKLREGRDRVFHVDGTSPAPTCQDSAWLTIDASNCLLQNISSHHSAWSPWMLYHLPLKGKSLILTFKVPHPSLKLASQLICLFPLTRSMACLILFTHAGQAPASGPLHFPCLPLEPFPLWIISPFRSLGRSSVPVSLKCETSLLSMPIDSRSLPLFPSSLSFFIRAGIFMYFLHCCIPWIPE